jgi:hypothetical protein
MTNRDGCVRTAILRYALHTQPATLESLAVPTRLTPEDVKAALAALHQAGAIYLRDGAVIAAYPFSLVPTQHRVTVAGVTAYEWPRLTDPLPWAERIHRTHGFAQIKFEH